METKNYTDIEQSKKLAKILSLESADMYYKYVLPTSNKLHHVPEVGDPLNALEWYNKGYTIGKNDPLTLEEYCVPCWSLASLLNIIPGGQVNRMADSNEWEASSWNDSDFEPSCYVEDYDNPVDACVALIIKLHGLNL